MKEKLYTLAGTSVVDGVVTYRFACGKVSERKATLTRNGHSAVDFRTLPRPMTLRDAVGWLRANNIHAVLPQGQRRGPNGKPVAAVPEVDPVAARKAAFVARMKAAKAAKKAAAAQQHVVDTV